MSLFVGFVVGALLASVVLWLMLRRSARRAASIAEAAERWRDEADRRLTETERDRSTREAILSSMEDGVLLFDQDGSVVYQNGRARQLLGSGLDNAQSLLQPALRELVTTAASDATPQPVEVFAGPAPRTLLTTASRISEGQTLLMLRDVTHARMMEAVRRDFVANASHELKTPVASIQALAETLVDAASNDPDEVPRFAAQLEREAIRLSRIVSDLLDLSRLEGEVVTMAEVRLDRLVAEEVGRLKPRAEEAGLRIESHLTEPAIVRGSARDLSLLTRNLLENAVQYTREGGKIAVSVRAEDGAAILEVSDTGIGIPAREQARIFERFYRVDRARSRETGGTGLGLSIVKHVVENHGGTVRVKSEVGLGSSFIVRLPIPA
jgi:two-component system sensor histidine kinase SenX3